MACMWMSEDDFQELVLSLPKPTHVVKLVSKVSALATEPSAGQWLEYTHQKKIFVGRSRG